MYKHFSLLVAVQSFANRLNLSTLQQFVTAKWTLINFSQLVRHCQMWDIRPISVQEVRTHCRYMSADLDICWWLWPTIVSVWLAYFRHFRQTIISVLSTLPKLPTALVLFLLRLVPQAPHKIDATVPAATTYKLLSTFVRDSEGQPQSKRLIWMVYGFGWCSCDICQTFYCPSDYCHSDYCRSDYCSSDYCPRDYCPRDYCPFNVQVTGWNFLC